MMTHLAIWPSSLLPSSVFLLLLGTLPLALALPILSLAILAWVSRDWRRLWMDWSWLGRGPRSLTRQLCSHISLKIPMMTL